MRPKNTLLSPQLEAFLAVARNKSMHGAAREIHLSQTAITQRIQTLEQRVKATLFIRTRHGVKLTADGEVLLRYCQIALELENTTLANIKGAGFDSSARICITGPSSIMSSRIIPQCSLILKKFPMLSVTFNMDDSNQRIKSLQDGTSQLAVIEPESVLDEMQTKIISPEKYVLVCCKEWKKRKLNDIIQHERIIDFDLSDPMTINYLKYHKLYGMARTDRHFVNRTDSLANMLIDGYGYGVLTAEFSRPYLKNNQLIMLNGGKTYSNQLILAWYPRPEPSSYFSAVIHNIK